MKYLIVAILGLVLGAAAAGVALYLNPLSEGSAPMPSLTDRVLHYSLPDHVLEFAVGEDVRLFAQDPGDDSLWEETIARSAVLGLVLNDASNQPAALASRLLSASTETDLLLRGVVVSDYWLVTIPNEGTLFVRADSNAWPFMKERLVPVWYLRPAVERACRILAYGRPGCGRKRRRNGHRGRVPRQRRHCGRALRGHGPRSCPQRRPG